MENPRKKARLPDEVAEQLRRMIIDSLIPTGDKLPTEGELTERFGVSRSTVREAIKLLQAEHLVEVRRGKGTYVVNNIGVANDPLGLRFTDQSDLLSNLMEARALIEPNIAYTAAKRRNRGQVLEMEALLDQMDAAHARGEDYTPFDCRFHTLIAECTQNDVLSRLVPLINDSIIAAVIHTSHVTGSYQRGAKCHRMIFEGIRDNQPEAAKAAAEKHIRQSLMDWDDVIQ